MRPDQLELAASARLSGLQWHEIAALFRERYHVNGLVAMRLAHAWSQRDAADEWCKRWPDDLKTFKNFSYWEQWPNPTGYAAPLRVLVKLAELYGCAVSDLMIDTGDFRHLDSFYGVRPMVDQAPATQALAVALEGVCGRLADADIDEVAAAGLTWADRLSPDTAGSVLLKLSAGLALAATQVQAVAPSALSAAFERDAIDELAGFWRLHRRDGADQPSGDHVIVLRRSGHRLVGNSLPHAAGNRLRLDVQLGEEQVMTGTWTAHEGDSTIFGCVRLHSDADREALRGQWIGFARSGFLAHGGAWELRRIEAMLSGRSLLAHRAAV